MKKIVLIISIILCLFIPIVYVYSDGEVTTVMWDNQGGSTDGTSNPSNVNPMTTYFLSSANIGIRIGFVDSNGEPQGKTKDFMLEGYNLEESSVYVTKEKYTKPSYFYTGSDMTWDTINAGNFTALSVLEDMFKGTEFIAGYGIVPLDFSGNIRSSVANYNYDNIFNTFNKPSNMSDTEYTARLTIFFNSLIRKFGITKRLTEYKVETGKEDTPVYDLFLVYEPISAVSIKDENSPTGRKIYVGTAYELAQIASKSDGGGFTTDCIGQTALCDLSKIVKRKLPCTSYLSGSFYDQMVQLGARKLLDRFTASSYFRGRIKITYDTATNVCNSSNQRFEDNLATSNAGIGIGILWISGTIYGDEDTPPTNPPSGNKFNCTPYYNVGTCINAESIEYQDSLQAKDYITPEYWNNCIFNDKGYYTIDPHKEANKNSALTYYEPSLGSQYCEVYCIETLTTNFASGDITVEAGSRFMWGYSQATGGRTCKTKSVNWSKFESDLKTANNNIIKSYANWRIEENREYALANNVKQIGDCGCVNNTTNVTCCTAERPVYSTCYGLKGEELKACKKNPPIVRYECVPGAADDTKIPKYSVSWSGYTVNGKYYSGNSENWCGNNKPTANVQGAKDAYRQAISYAEGLVQAMKKCYTWDENSIYNTSPQATITYSDGKNYNYSGKLDTSTNYSMTDSSNCIHQEVNQIKGCDGTSCPSTPVSMLNCSGTDANGNKRFVEKTRTAITVFSLNADIFRYVLKSNNLSIHRFELPNYTNSNFTTNYYDIGESNFPVSYSIPDGLYGSMHGRGNLDLTYSNLGHLKAGQTTTDIDTILSTAESGKYGKWQCQFTVYSDLIPDPNNPNNPNNPNGGPGDIRVVYRTIDLIDPFPDIDGSKRNTGSNWCSFDGNCSYNNKRVVDFINNNRGVSDYEIYSGDPMYTFVLTPSIIKEIRRYNSVNSYADYTGSLDGKNYDYKCNNGSETGRYCISDYLSYIINITGAKNEPGSCVADKYRNYNDTANFEACRY